ncbi:DMT family transporter [uncultured Psychrosphaera sp.]|uniref:DMT family transporter n=1 Tax=uncultured Psychrosphaera sp. TaxID=1403522 RepID=UPI00263900B2|nr:DMT family transporter [uncultured Psychrosphaera sp.]
MPIQTFKLLAFISFALIAFAGNSVLCRLALGQGLIDASSFTSIRLLSGIVSLLVISLILVKGNVVSVVQEFKKQNSLKTWLASLMLFVYAVTFSYGYISLDTGTGALILFGLVQLTMIIVGALYGNKLHFAEWLGIALAFVGVIYLVLPSLSTPSLLGFILMALSGIAWAIYTLLGRGSKQPIIDTTANFLRTIPFVLVLILLTFEYSKITDWGMIYAILSGAVTSAIGYALWYLVLKDISVTQAAVVQLLVPILAAVGGVLFVSEPISIRLVISSLLVLGGILIVIMGRRYYTKS